MHITSNDPGGSIPTMTIFRIKSAALRAEGHRFETTDAKSAQRKLAEVRERDPQAKLLVLRPGR